MQAKVAKVQDTNAKVISKVAQAEEINASIDALWKAKFGGPVAPAAT